MKDTDTIEELKLHIQNSDIYPMYPSDIANILKELSDDDFKYYIKKLPSEIVADVALELPDRYFGNIAREVSVEDLSVGLKELESDDQTDFIQEIEEVDKQKAKDLFNTLDLDDQEDITKLKSYNEDQAGSYMQTEVFTARLDEKVCDVIDRF
ncbi:MAG TPA: magnesium transporter, partial [Campylobacterales bacterium]|nr:magnesium transporter [Campylobacterales bacterium]